MEFVRPKRTRPLPKVLEIEGSEEKKTAEFLAGYVCDTFQKRFVNSNRVEKAHIIVINPVINTCKKVLTCTLQPCEKAAILFDEKF